MIIEPVSLTIGAIFGFIIGIAIIKENSNSLVHEYREENLKLQYESQILNRDNRQLRSILKLMDNETLEIYQKGDMKILTVTSEDHE